MMSNKDYYGITLLDFPAPRYEQDIHGEGLYYFAQLQRQTDCLRLICKIYRGKPNAGAQEMIGHEYLIESKPTQITRNSVAVVSLIGDDFMACPNFQPALFAALLESCLEPYV